jgi:taurine dioxygenase
MHLKIIPTGDALGAEISGVDLTKEIDDATFDQIRQAFYQNEVVCFRNQELSDDDHVRFSARFGELRKLKKLRTHSLHRPEIVVISNIMEEGKYIGSYDSGMFWHTDGAHIANPHAASLLRAIEVPEKDGHTLGATRFASMTAAYDTLPSGMKKRIEGLEALHSHLHRDEKATQAGHKPEELSEEQKKNAEAVHPVVRIHPSTGRKCLYLSEGYAVRILGIPEAESKDLLAELTMHCIQPQFLYTHSWQVHDLVMWDNCSTQHKATFDYALPLRRLLYRTTVTRFA